MSATHDTQASHDAQPNASAAARGTTLVIGGTGKTGRRVADRLTARGLSVRIGSRSATPPFDWEDERTWAPALEGASAAYIAYVPDLAAPGALEAVRKLSRLAVERGVRRLVLLSGRNEPEAQRAETELRASGADWTIVRASWFMQNFTEAFLRDAVAAGEVALPVGPVGEPFIDVDDIADVAVAALLDDKHIGQVYEVTGPRLLTYAEAVAEVAKATGRDIRFVQVTPDAYSAELTKAGLPPDYVSLIMYLFTEILDGRGSNLADGVQRALGRPPRDFADFVRAAAAANAWG